MRFKYKTTNHRIDKIPLLEVIVSTLEKDKKVAYTALLDSGAFMNVFHSDIAHILDIDLTKVKQTVGFGGVGMSGGSLKGKPYIVNLMVAQKGKSISFDSFVLFSDDINPEGAPLLGRLGFFDQVSRVEFSLKKDYFYIYK